MNVNVQVITDVNLILVPAKSVSHCHWFSFLILCLLFVIDSCFCLFQDWTLLQHTSIESICVTYSQISSYFTKRSMLSSFFFLLSQVLYLNTRSNDSNYLSKHKFYLKLFLPSQVLWNKKSPTNNLQFMDCP